MYVRVHVRVHVHVCMGVSSVFCMLTFTSFTYTESAVPIFTYPMYNTDPYVEQVHLRYPLRSFFTHTSSYPLSSYTLLSHTPPLPLPVRLDVHRYPKPGYPNPLASVHVYDVATNTSVEVSELKAGSGSVWEYVTSVQWAADNVSILLLSFHPSPLSLPLPLLSVFFSPSSPTSLFSFPPYRLCLRVNHR